MNEMILRLLRAARGAGVRISTAEALDAFGVVDLVGFSDRQMLKDSLTLSLAKTVEEKQLFENCFDLYFAHDQAPAPQTESQDEPRPDNAGQSEMAQLALDNDQAAISAAMNRAADEIGASNITLFTQTNMYAFRILERMGLPELDREIDALRGTGTEEDARTAERLEAARTAIAAQARAYMERQLTLFSAGTTREIREGALRSVRLSQLDRRDVARMRTLVREIAKRLATRYSRRRWKSRRGVLDARRTIRKNMANDGLLFRTVWKRTRIDRPRVMVLCDVSGSVAPVARFLLMFLYALSDALSDIRSFAYSSHLVEVSDILEQQDTEAAIEKILETIGFGSSNYGVCLDNFSELAFAGLNRDTTVLILGDARGNRNDPRIDVMKQIFDRSGRVIWLNPEPRSLWGTGDSDILRYEPYCHQVTPCGTIAQLETVISDMLRTS
jgi:uncharacterized protein with von Willebrand factor type A (vWA) domain